MTERVLVTKVPRALRLIMVTCTGTRTEHLPYPILGRPLCGGPTSFLADQELGRFYNWL